MKAFPFDVQALENLRAILDASGSSPSRVLKTTVLLADMNDFASVNTVYEGFFGVVFPRSHYHLLCSTGSHKPARACFAVKGLPRGVLVEVEAIAAAP